MDFEVALAMLLSREHDPWVALLLQVNPTPAAKYRVKYSICGIR